MPLTRSITRSITQSERLREWFHKYESLVIKLLEDSEIKAQIIKCGIVQGFTTKKFCKYRDLCSQDDYRLNIEDRVSTNKELSNFFQTIYHAGTSQHFWKYAKVPEGLITQVDTTFHYMFDIFKKGIFVNIHNNILQVYLPFSNANYYNEWGQNIRTRGGNFNDVLQIAKRGIWNGKTPWKYHVDIQPDPTKWYANYNFFRNTMYVNGDLKGKDDEGDKTVIEFLTLLTELCYVRKIPDVCFFLSPRDYPILRKDRKHPYERLFRDDKIPTLDYQEMLPIFSQSVTETDYVDELIPTEDDIKQIFCRETTIFAPWKQKKDIALFRGTATGPDVTETTNPRLHLIEMAKSYPQLIDAKLTGINDKIKVDSQGFVAQINIRKYPPKKELKENFLTPQAQSKYKYIIHIEGHTAAFRLSRELSYGSLILKVDSQWKIWYSDKIKGFHPLTDSAGQDRQAHYISIKHDLSDLVETIEWCKTHDHICNKIAERGYKFWKEHLEGPTYMLDYMQNKLTDIAKKQSSREPRGLILIPFRETADGQRGLQLKELIQVLDKEKIDYKVVIQEDDKLFNKGLLINRAILDNPDYDYYIIHDVDLIPDTELLPYYYEYPKLPIHLGARGQRWSGAVGFIGGVLSISKHDYYKVNGFPLDYSGWGKEDDALLWRLNHQGIKVENPPQGSVKDLENLTIDEKLEKLWTTGERTEELKSLKKKQIEENKINWSKNGIKQLIN